VSASGLRRAEARPDTRPSALLLSGVRRGVLLVFVPVALAGQAIAWLEYAVSGLYRPWSWVKIGVAYALASVRVPFDVSASDVGAAEPGPPRSSMLVVALGALTVGVLVLAFRSGRAQANGLDKRPIVAAVGGAAVGLGFAAPMFIVAIPVDLGFPNVGISSFRPALFAAFALPLLVGGLAGAAGGIGAARGRLQRLGWVGHVEVAGRAAAFAAAWGLSLAFLGFLALAVTENDATTAYGRGIGGLDRAGAVLLVHHALVLPNQSAMMLATSMGAPTAVRLNGEDVASVRVTGVDVSGAPALVLGARRGTSFTVAFSAWYALFFLVPIVATILGGRTLTTADPDAPRQPRRARRDALLRGALATPIFAGLCAVAVWAASITVPIPFSVVSGSLHVGADPVRTGVLALPWGAVGLVIGSQLPRRTA
jgi:hypothetical protein